MSLADVDNHRAPQDDSVVWAVRSHDDTGRAFRSLETFVDVTDGAIAELCRLGTHARSGDDWTFPMMKQYLSYTWLRLIEQQRVQHVYGERAAGARLGQLGHLRHLLVFRSGLFDCECRPIECIVTETGNRNRGSQAYTLLMEGVQVAGVVDGPCQQIREAVARDGGQTFGEVREASFFQPRDQRLLFDHTAQVGTNDRHIVEERLDRLVDAGIIDPNEAWIHFGTQAEANAALAPVHGARWVECEVHEGLAVGVSGRQRDRYLGQRLWCFQKWVATGRFVLRRHNLGVTACALKVRKCIDDSVQVAKRNYMTVVPQFYYGKQRVVERATGRALSVHCGTLQLLLPLFSASGDVVAALSVDESRPGGNGGEFYFASTILALPWALGNARLLTTPQAPWLRKGRRG